MSDIKSYRDLETWQTAVELATLTYVVTAKCPRSELFGLTAHARRTAVSIPSNIAEGQPLSNASFIRHLLIAKGSCAELDTQVELAARLNLVNSTDGSALQKMITRTTQLLNALARSLGHRW
jgi:four helix bundle protein